jgi:predicted GNAT family N-acyltransferase
VIEVRPARDEVEVDGALALRRDVFCVEQGVSLDDELDGRDGDALHLVVVERDGAVVGTCRLLVEGCDIKLGRMAVARAHRGRGLAQALLAEAEARARELGGERIVLGAQLTAQALYERTGYVPYGEVFLDAGIEHVMMAKGLGAGAPPR